MASTTLGSILSSTLLELLTIMFIRTTCVRPEPCASSGLNDGAQLAMATRSLSASYRPISRIHQPPTSSGMTCSAMMIALLVGSTLSWLSGARWRSLISAVCAADGIGSVPLASPTPIWVIFQAMPRASALACLAVPMLVRMAKN
ncbi:hypothetical protein D3C75_1015170 [compost metagenome]